MALQMGQRAAFRLIRQRCSQTNNYTCTSWRRCFASSPRHRTRAQRLQNDASLAFAKSLVATIAILSGGISAVVMAQMEAAHDENKNDDQILLEPLRSESFHLMAHSHKSTAHVFKVVRKEEPMQSIQDYTIHMTLVSSDTKDSFLTGDNAKIVTSDAQQNLAQMVAQRYSFDSPEEFGMILAQRVLMQYAWLDAIDLQVTETVWDRVWVDGQIHPHGFTKSPVKHHATVHLERGQGPMVSSSMSHMVLLKSAQSGFEGFHRDEYTLLPETSDRCMSTQLEAIWTYAPMSFHQVDYCALRKNIQKLLHKGFFGPPSTNGIYSPSLQATLYDAACLVLSEEPHLQALSLYASELHLSSNGRPGLEPQANNGIIACTVNRGSEIIPRRPSLLKSSTASPLEARPRPVRLQPQRSNLPKY
ncbi:hypothetical protein MPSEU_000592900 [Mayamaea pseudoterrestris]|nr:hypothetical protein MPSEU_000592900 [Mayamaea pseudoterrestris]